MSQFNFIVCFSCFLLSGARIYAFYVPAAFLAVVNLAFFVCISCTIGGSSTSDFKPHRDTDGLVVDGGLEDDGLDSVTPTTNLDSLSPTTNMDSITPVVTGRRHPSQLSSLATTGQQHPSQLSSLATTNSQYSSLVDVQYKPSTQLHLMVAFLLLYAVTWVNGAFAVALPFSFTHQSIVFNCAYLFCSTSLGLFIIGFFVFGRRDSRDTWYKMCCCVKNDECDMDIVANNRYGSSLRSNGHIVQSVSSLDAGSQYSNKSSNPYRYGPVYPLDQSDLSVLHTDLPPTMDGSIIESIPEYPNFFNAKQNGIAKKYWQKNRQKHKIAQLNRDLHRTRPENRQRHGANSRVSFDDSSDQNTHISLEIQLEPRSFAGMLGDSDGSKHRQAFYPSHSKYPNMSHFGVSIDGPKDGSMPPLIVPYERCQLAPMVGVSSPPSTTALLPPDGGSFISTEMSGPSVPPAPMTSPQSSGINYHLPSSHSLPRPQRAPPVQPVYMQRNGSVPRLRDFDGKSSTSRETRPLSIGSDSHTMESSFVISNAYNDYHNNMMQIRQQSASSNNDRSKQQPGYIRPNHSAYNTMVQYPSSSPQQLVNSTKDTVQCTSTNNNNNNNPASQTNDNSQPVEQQYTAVVHNTESKHRPPVVYQHDHSNNNNNSGGENSKDNVQQDISRRDNDLVVDITNKERCTSQTPPIKHQTVTESPSNTRFTHPRPVHLNLPTQVLSSNYVDDGNGNCNVLSSADQSHKLVKHRPPQPLDSCGQSGSTAHKPVKNRPCLDSCGQSEMDSLLLSVDDKQRCTAGSGTDEGGGSDIWKPQKPAQTKLKNMETCV